MAIQKQMIIIAGPTAVGKTSVAINLALQFNTEIISADSRQCYKEMKIGVARPSEEELAKVPHHFIASHSIHEPVNAVTYEQYALQKTKDIFQKNHTVIVVGGTGLYIKALTEGMDDIPSIPAALRKNIIDNYNEKGIGWLQEQVRLSDPLFHASGEMQNPQRMMRALEVVQFTGRSIIDFRKGKKAERDFNIRKIGLELPRELLYQRINARVDKMMEAGLLEEVKSLHPYKHLNALQTVGYQELFDFIDGKHSLETAVELIKRNTRHYAKRQLTWFKKDAEFGWMSAEKI
jgi:tRNA dimethylallyltransferase